ncbi:hypothetical protein D3C80_1461800 [compost metagenome]
MVRTSARFDPAWGSDRHMVPNQRPAISGKAKVSTWAAEPKVAMRRALAVVSIG